MVEYLTPAKYEIQSSINGFNTAHMTDKQLARMALGHTTHGGEVSYLAKSLAGTWLFRFTLSYTWYGTDDGFDLPKSTRINWTSGLTYTPGWSYERTVKRHHAIATGYYGGGVYGPVARMWAQGEFKLGFPWTIQSSYPCLRANGLNRGHRRFDGECSDYD
ncbi:MAG: hypothetical protein ACRC35_08500 [Angustibacter sp.]